MKKIELSEVEKKSYPYKGMRVIVYLYNGEKYILFTEHKRVLGKNIRNAINDSYQHEVVKIGKKFAFPLRLVLGLGQWYDKTYDLMQALDVTADETVSGVPVEVTKTPEVKEVTCCSRCSHIPDEVLSGEAFMKLVKKLSKGARDIVRASEWRASKEKDKAGKRDKLRIVPKQKGMVLTPLMNLKDLPYVFSGRVIKNMYPFRYLTPADFAKVFGNYAELEAMNREQKRRTGVHNWSVFWDELTKEIIAFNEKFGTKLEKAVVSKHAKTKYGYKKDTTWMFHTDLLIYFFDTKFGAPPYTTMWEINDGIDHVIRSNAGRNNLTMFEGFGADGKPLRDRKEI